MKFIMVSILAAMSTTSLAAQEVSFFSEAEYALEADIFEVGIGADISVNRWTITPALYADHVLNETDFNRFELTVNYDVRDNWKVYVTVESDRDFDYAETTFGTRVEF